MSEYSQLISDKIDAMRAAFIESIEAIDSSADLSEAREKISDQIAYYDGLFTEFLKGGAE